MPQNKKSQVSVWLDLGEKNALSKMRRYRLMQICTVTALGLSAILTVAKGITIIIFSIGLCFLLLAFGLAFKHKVLSSAYILLGSMTSMLFALALTGAGLFDLAILGYPGLLVFSAILGGVGLFLPVIMLVSAQCVFIA